MMQGSVNKMRPFCLKQKKSRGNFPCFFLSKNIYKKN